MSEGNTFLGLSTETLILMSLFAAYISIFVSLLMFLTKRKIKRTNDFFNVINIAFDTGTLNTIEDIYNLYKGLNNYDLESDIYRPNINKLLRQYLYRLQSKKFNDTDEIKIKERKEKIDELIKKNEKLSPFSELPQAEKNIMNDLFSYAEKNDVDSLKRKMFELSNAIQIRKEEFDKVEKQNKWSIPLAVVGLILTIVFGILSLI
ncbi:hypothetical protein [Peribacillus butanolivorans]|uniref:hypothetical protein n=1 Tax=Peribacillus butanolivorans TaxID=421767 RepID=UPI00381CBA89